MAQGDSISDEQQVLWTEWEKRGSRRQFAVSSNNRAQTRTKGNLCARRILASKSVLNHRRFLTQVVEMIGPESGIKLVTPSHFAISLNESRMREEWVCSYFPVLFVPVNKGAGMLCRGDDPGTKRTLLLQALGCLE